MRSLRPCSDSRATPSSSKVNGNTSGKPQAFKLIKLVEVSNGDNI